MIGLNRGGIPVIGSSEQQQKLAAHQMIMGCYLSLIPVVATNVLANANMYADHDEIPDRIADETWKVTRAVVRKLGIEIPEQPGVK